MGDPEITPSDLKFRFQLNKPLPATINIYNPHKQRLAFKVKTTTPKKYCVKPSSGSVEPHGSTIVSVSMQAPKEMPADFANCKDKFLIQTVLLNPGEEVGPDSFRKENKALREAKLRVILEGPPAPPSPVPEANEGEEDSSTTDVKNNFYTVATARPTSADTTPVSTTGPTAPSPAATPKPITTGNQSAAADQGLLAGKYDKLRVEYERSERDRKELKSKLERLEATSRSSTAKVATVASDKRWNLIQIILVALLAFLIGHFT